MLRCLLLYLLKSSCCELALQHNKARLAHPRKLYRRVSLAPAASSALCAYIMPSRPHRKVPTKNSNKYNIFWAPTSGNIPTKAEIRNKLQAAGRQRLISSFFLKGYCYCVVVYFVYFAAPLCLSTTHTTDPIRSRPSPNSKRVGAWWVCIGKVFTAVVLQVNQSSEVDFVVDICYFVPVQDDVTGRYDDMIPEKGTERNGTPK